MKLFVTCCGEDGGTGILEDGVWTSMAKISSTGKAIYNNNILVASIENAGGDTARSVLCVYNTDTTEYKMLDIGSTAEYLDIHDIVIWRDYLLITNTQKNCIYVLDPTDEKYNILYTYYPFGERNIDSIHLNGLCVIDNDIYFVCWGDLFKSSEWKNKAGGGFVCRISDGWQSNSVVIGGLSCPHSLKYANGCLYIIESLGGHLNVYDTIDTRFHRKARYKLEFSFPRGFAIFDNKVYIGSSANRTWGHGDWASIYEIKLPVGPWADNVTVTNKWDIPHREIYGILAI